MQKPNNIFLDINVLIDIADNERENHLYSQEIFSLADNSLITASCSILSFNIFFYVAKKRLGSLLVIEYMNAFMEIFKILPADIDIAKQSLLEPIGNDFEDNLQYYSAMQVKNLDYIVSANTNDFKKSKVPVITPLQFIKIYQSV
ncbi:MAG: hypothetical protein WDM90_12150 [Ferruginibacter sp.]